MKRARLTQALEDLVHLAGQADPSEHLTDRQVVPAPVVVAVAERRDLEEPRQGERQPTEIAHAQPLRAARPGEIPQETPAARNGVRGAHVERREANDPLALVDDVTCGCALAHRPRPDPEPLEQPPHVVVLEPHAVLPVIERLLVDAAGEREAVRIARPRPPAQVARVRLAEGHLDPPLGEVQGRREPGESASDDDDHRSEETGPGSEPKKRRWTNSYACASGPAALTSPASNPVR